MTLLFNFHSLNCWSSYFLCFMERYCVIQRACVCTLPYMTAWRSISRGLRDRSVWDSTVSCQFWESTTSSSRGGASGNNASGVSTLLTRSRRKESDRKQERETERVLDWRFRLHTCVWSEACTVAWDSPVTWKWKNLYNLSITPASIKILLTCATQSCDFCNKQHLNWDL